MKYPHSTHMGSVSPYAPANYHMGPTFGCLTGSCEANERMKERFSYEAVKLFVTHLLATISQVTKRKTVEMYSDESIDMTRNKEVHTRHCWVTAVGCHLCTRWTVKTCHFVFDHISGISRAIFTYFVPVKTGLNTVYSLNGLMTLYRVTLNVTKLRLQQYYLQFDITVTDRVMECVRSKWLFATFAESGPMFVSPMLVGKL